MSLISAAIDGNLEAAMRAEIRTIAAGLRRAVTRAATETQAELRRQARKTGFRDGGSSLANAWRLRVFPASGVETLHPAALIWSKVPDIAEAFNAGQPIRARHHTYLCWPTGYNAAGGRRGANGRGGMRITPSQMIGAGAFVVRSKRNPRVKLWCLRVRQGAGGKRGRLRLLVRAGTEVLTGRMKGRQARAREVLKQGFVPMFFLVKQVTPGKRLDIAAARRRSVDLAVAAMIAELRR
jgi:hypothetical protein